MKYKFMLIAISLLSSCAIKNIAGMYASSRTGYRIQLNKDSTFSYRYHEGILVEHSSGRWYGIEAKRIKLVSYHQTRYLSLSGKETNTLEGDGTVNLKIESGIPQIDQKYFWCLIFINDNLYKKVSCDSLSKFKVGSPLLSVQLKIVVDNRMPMRIGDTLSSEKFVPFNKNSTDIVLHCGYIDSLFNYKIFNGLILKFSGEKLKYMNHRLSKMKAGVGG